VRLRGKLRALRRPENPRRARRPRPPRPGHTGGPADTSAFSATTRARCFSTPTPDRPPELAGRAAPRSAAPSGSASPRPPAASRSKRPGTPWPGATAMAPRSEPTRRDRRQVRLTRGGPAGRRSAPSGTESSARATRSPPRTSWARLRSPPTTRSLRRRWPLGLRGRDYPGPVGDRNERHCSTARSTCNAFHDVPRDPPARFQLGRLEVPPAA